VEDAYELLRKVPEEVKDNSNFLSKKEFVTAEDYE